MASRRGDTCAFAAGIQRQVIQILAQEMDPVRLSDVLPEVLAFVREQLAALKKKEIPLEKLIIDQTLSRELDRYSVLSPMATAAHQLKAHGKTVGMGRRIRYIYIARAPGVHAWNLPSPPDPHDIDVLRYRELVLRAVQEVLQPIGVTEAILKNWVIGRAGYLASPGLLATTDPTRLALPLLAGVKYLRLDT